MSARIHNVRKYLIFALIAVFVCLVGGSVIGGCGIAGSRALSQALEHKLSNKDWNYMVMDKCLYIFPKLRNWKDMLNERTYLVIFQNNNELRPSGGFMGSYVRITTDSKGIRDILVQDIYQPDGQISGHVVPPYPIQEAFGQGWWKLRDANWDVDFERAAETMKWFFVQGGEQEVDGLVAVNQKLIKEILKVIGPIELVTYPEKVDAENLDRLGQEYAQINNDKRGFLGAVGVGIIERIKAEGGWKKMSVMKKIFDELEKGEIVVWMEDETWQEVIKDMEWSGSLGEGWNKKGDYMYLVESNLGTNKANCCVERYVTQAVDDEGGLIEVRWKNNNVQSVPNPPENWGGDYRNYVRMVIPESKSISEITVGERVLRKAVDEDFGLPSELRQGLSEDIYIVEKREGLQILGFWAEVKAGEERKATIEYVGQKTEERAITVGHQPGMGTLAYTLKVNGKVVAEERLEEDLRIVWIK